MMANLNQSLEFDVVEMLVIDYGKTLKKEETRDISNFEEYELVDDEPVPSNEDPLEVAPLWNISHP